MPIKRQFCLDIKKNCVLLIRWQCLFEAQYLLGEIWQYFN